jgi:hypothetical protein
MGRMAHSQDSQRREKERENCTCADMLANRSLRQDPDARNTMTDDRISLDGSTYLALRQKQNMIVLFLARHRRWKSNKGTHDGSRQKLKNGCAG